MWCDYHDRAKQVDKLEGTKAGVKGLVDFDVLRPFFGDSTTRAVV